MDGYKELILRANSNGGVDAREIEDITEHICASPGSKRGAIRRDTIETAINIAQVAWKLASAATGEDSARMERSGLSLLQFALSVSIDSTSIVQDTLLVSQRYNRIFSGSHLARIDLQARQHTSRSRLVAMQQVSRIARELARCIAQSPTSQLENVARAMAGFQAGFPTGSDQSQARMVSENVGLAKWVSESARNISGGRSPLQDRMRQGERLRILAHAPPLLRLVAETCSLDEQIALLGATARIGQRLARSLAALPYSAAEVVEMKAPALNGESTSNPSSSSVYTDRREKSAELAQSESVSAAVSAIADLRRTATESGQADSRAHRHYWYLSQPAFFPWPNAVWNVIDGPDSSSRGGYDGVARHSFRYRAQRAAHDASQGTREGRRSASTGDTSSVTGRNDPNTQAMSFAVAASQMQAQLFIGSSGLGVGRCDEVDAPSLQDAVARTGASAEDLLGCVQCFASVLQLQDHEGADLLDMVFLPVLASHPRMASAYRAVSMGDFAAASSAHLVFDAVHAVSTMSNRQWLYGGLAQCRSFPNMQRHTTAVHPLMDTIMSEAVSSLFNVQGAAHEIVLGSTGSMENDSQETPPKDSLTVGLPKLGAGNLPGEWPTELRASRGVSSLWSRQQYTMRDSKDNNAMLNIEQKADRALRRSFSQGSNSRNQGRIQSFNGRSEASKLAVSASLEWWTTRCLTRFGKAAEDGERGVRGVLSRGGGYSSGSPFSIANMSGSMRQKHRSSVNPAKLRERLSTLRGYMQTYGDEEQQRLMLGLSTADLIGGKVPNSFGQKAYTFLPLLQKEEEWCRCPFSYSLNPAATTPAAAMILEQEQSSSWRKTLLVIRQSRRKFHAARAIRQDAHQMRAVLASSWSNQRSFHAVCPPISVAADGSDIDAAKLQERTDEAIAALASTLDATFSLGTSHLTPMVIGFAMEALAAWAPLMRQDSRLILTEPQTETLVMVAHMVLNSMRAAEAGTHDAGFKALAEILGYDSDRATASISKLLHSLLAGSTAQSEPVKAMLQEALSAVLRRKQLGSRMILLSCLGKVPHAELSSQGGAVFLASAAAEQAITVAFQKHGIVAGVDEQAWTSNSVSDVLQAGLGMGAAGLFSAETIPSDVIAQSAYVQLLGQKDLTEAALRKRRAELISQDALQGLARTQARPEVNQWIICADNLVRLGAIARGSQLQQLRVGAAAATSADRSSDVAVKSRDSFGIFEGTPMGAVLNQIFSTSRAAVKAIEAELGASWSEHRDRTLDILAANGVAIPQDERIPESMSIVDLACISACGYYHPVMNTLDFEDDDLPGVESRQHRAAMPDSASRASSSQGDSRPHARGSPTPIAQDRKFWTDRRQLMMSKKADKVAVMREAIREARDGKSPSWKAVIAFLQRAPTSGTERTFLSALRETAEKQGGQSQDALRRGYFEVPLPGLGYRVDAVWPGLDTVLEYDGPFHSVAMPLPEREAREAYDRQLQGRSGNRGSDAPLAQACYAGRNLTASSASTGLRVIREFNRFDNPGYSTIMTVEPKSIDEFRSSLLQAAGWRVARFPFWLLYRSDPSQTEGVAGEQYGLLPPQEARSIAAATLQRVVSAADRQRHSQGSTSVQ